MHRHTFCSDCGTRYAQVSRYPRTCGACGKQTWVNPLPVAVVLVPVRDGERLGVLVVRRAVPPGIGKLALVSGFLEDHEDWRTGAAREVREETGLVLDAVAIEPLTFASTTPRPNRILMLARAAEVGVDALPPHHADLETLERGLVYGPDGLASLFVYDFHVDVVSRFFATVGIAGPAAFTRR